MSWLGGSESIAPGELRLIDAKTNFLSKLKVNFETVEVHESY